MVNITLLEGLKRALVKGNSLKQAMMSFYNAGYTKQEIEEAARALQMQQRGQPLPIQQKSQPLSIQPKPIQQKKFIPKQIQKKAILKQVENKAIVTNPQPIQKISNYDTVTTNQKQESIQKIKQGINNAMNELKRIEFPNSQITPNNVPIPQNVSSYDSKPTNKILAAVLIIFLILLLGFAISLFIFKDQIIEIIKGLGF